MSAQLAHAALRLVQALRQHFPFLGDAGAVQSEPDPRFRQAAFARILEDLPEDAAPDQAFLTGLGLRYVGPVVTGVVGPLRLANRLLEQAAPSPRVEHLRLLFGDLLESRAYEWHVVTPTRPDVTPAGPDLPQRSCVVGTLLPQNPALLDSLRQAAQALLDDRRPPGLDERELSDSERAVVAVLRAADPDPLQGPEMVRRLERRGSDLQLSRVKWLLRPGGRLRGRGWVIHVHGAGYHLSPAALA
jgi:hypothetical protein